MINHARQHILAKFSKLSEERKAAHFRHISSLSGDSVDIQPSECPPNNESQLEAQIHEANLQLKRGIDADWKTSLLMYPEVLDYFYSLVEIRVPQEDSPRVADPPLTTSPYIYLRYSANNPFSTLVR